MLRQNIYDFAYKTGSLGLLSLILQYVSGVLLSYSSLRQVFKIRQQFFEKTLYQDIGWFDVNQTGEFATTFSENLTKIEEGIGEKVSLCVYYLTVAVSGIGISLFMGWELTLACIILLPIASLLTVFISKIGSKFSKNEMESYASAGSIAEEVFSAIRTVVAFDGQKKEEDRFDQHLSDAKKNNIRRSLFTGVSEGVLYFFMYASVALAAWFSIDLIIEGRELGSNARKYDPGVITGIIYVNWGAYWNIYMAAPFLRIFGIACGAATKVFKVLDSEPKINVSLDDGIKPNKCEGEIIFDGVHFRYPSRQDVKILNGVNLTIKPGETVAFVGSSGCGKSTCIQLIQRFYDPIEGRVFVDGNNIKDLNLSWWRSHIGVVGQEPSLFATSIAENIRYGKLDVSQEEIERAAKRAQVHEFIVSLPQGYESVIGERGTQISGGQKQRIAIARALVREPSILLLDEATSALDTTSEAEVQAAIDAISGQCTTVIIAHRLSTVRNADRIIVFSQGVITEQGSYQELMQQKGTFYNLVKAQTGDNIHKKNEDIPENAVETEEEIFSEDESKVDLPEVEIKDKPKKILFELGAISAAGGMLDVLKLNEPEWPWIVLGSLCSAIIGASFPVSLILMANIIGEFFIQNPDELMAATYPQMVMILLIGVVSGLTYIVQYYAFGIAGENLTKRVRSKMFSTMMKQEMGWFDRKENAVGAICAKLSSDGAAIQAACGASIGIIMNSVATLLVATGFAYVFQWEVALILSTFIPIIILATYCESRMNEGNADFREKMLQKSAAIAVEAICNIRTVVSLGCEKVFLKQYTKELEPYIISSKKQSHFRAFQLGIARVLMSYGYLVGFFYGSRLVISSNIPYRTIIKVLDLQVQGSYAVGQAFAFLPSFQNGLKAAKRIFPLFRRKPAIRNASYAIQKEWETGDIEFSKVHFSYPTRPQIPVLQGLDLKISAGKTVALVGSSGCGKSTIIQLLERFYNQTDGEITIDDTDIRTIDLQHLRKQFGIVSQEPSLFDRTIAANIAYGNNHKNVTEEEIIEAARNANIHEFISSLPLGYETRLGTKGTQLSGGQKQRIAIARALLRNPKVLLLDEATSALDTESEKVKTGLHKISWKFAELLCLLIWRKPQNLSTTTCAPAVTLSYNKNIILRR
ncbi:hypothetical protein HHI36_019063 [Cryptolaemus montrouzieri]|uniref:Uncharacterized protein n=1 Tax=Cryptolaemus montrouzieri TaxID=559131 RepID=A0ABD2P219_9CUCU